jgi:hypothetical protein
LSRLRCTFDCVEALQIGVAIRIVARVMVMNRIHDYFPRGLALWRYPGRDSGIPEKGLVCHDVY